jgi:hypothetical protein
MIKTHDDEEWKQINYPKLKEEYYISNYGSVYSKLSKKILSNKNLRGGYISSSLTMKDGKDKQFRVHQLVAYTFLGFSEENKNVNHKDGNKLNNYINNLEYMTSKENTKHAFDTGLNKRIKRKVRQFDLDGKFIKEHESILDAGKSIERDSRFINNVCKGRKKTAYGFKWEYSEINPNENSNVDLSAFKSLLDFPNYKINNKGDIYNVSHKKFRTKRPNHDGTLTITLQYKTKQKSCLVHRLVAELFLENPDKKERVRHRDKNKLNNHVDNLEYY